MKKEYFYKDWELKEDKVIGWVNNFAITLSDVYAID